MADGSEYQQPKDEITKAHTKVLCYDGVVNVPQFFYEQLLQAVGKKEEEDGDVLPGTKQEIIAHLRRLRLLHTFTTLHTLPRDLCDLSPIASSLLTPPILKSLCEMPHVEGAVKWWISNLPFAKPPAEHKEYALYTKWLQALTILRWKNVPALAWKSKCTFYDSWLNSEEPITKYALEFVDHFQRSQKLTIPSYLVWYAMVAKNDFPGMVAQCDMFGFVKPANAEEKKQLQDYHLAVKPPEPTRPLYTIPLHTSLTPPRLPSPRHSSMSQSEEEDDDDDDDDDDDYKRPSSKKASKSRSLTSWASSKASALMKGKGRGAIKPTVMYTRAAKEAEVDELTLFMEEAAVRDDDEDEGRPLEHIPMMTYHTDTATDTDDPTTHAQPHSQPISTFKVTTPQDFEHKKSATPPQQHPVQFSIEELASVFRVLKQRVEEMSQYYTLLYRAFSNNTYMDRISTVLTRIYGPSCRIMVEDTPNTLCHEPENLPQTSKRDDFPVPVCLPVCNHPLYAKRSQQHQSVGDESLDEDGQGGGKSRKKKQGGTKKKTPFRHRLTVYVEWPQCIVDHFLWSSVS